MTIERSEGEKNHVLQGTAFLIHDVQAGHS